MRLCIASDEDAPIVGEIVTHIGTRGHDVERIAFGCEWPEVGRQVAEAVAAGDYERGIVCCHTGTGVSIAANKIRGIRAALCNDAATASGARRWNDANVLALGLAQLNGTNAPGIVDAFIDTETDPNEQRAIARLEAR